LWARSREIRCVGILAMSVPPPRPLDGLTIPVVDDHPDSVAVLQEYLGSVGARAI